MWTWAKNLFSSDSSKVLDMASGIGNWIDEQQLTDEERAELSLRAVDAQIRWLDATRGFALARRVLAFGVFAVFLYMVFVMFHVFLWKLYEGDLEAFEVMLGAWVRFMEACGFSGVVLAVTVLYFGNKVLDSVLGGAGRGAGNKQGKG